MADINWRDSDGWAAAAFNAEMNLLEEQIGSIENLKKGSDGYNELKKIFDSKYGVDNFEKFIGLRGQFINVVNDLPQKEQDDKSNQQIALSGGLREKVVTQLSQGKLWPIVTDQQALPYWNYFRIVKRIDESYAGLWKSKSDAFQVVLFGNVNMMLQWWATNAFDVKSDYYKASTKLSFQLGQTKERTGFEFNTVIAELAGGKAFLMDAKNPGKVIKDWHDPNAWQQNIKEWAKKGKKVAVTGLNLGVLSEAFIVSPIFAKEVGSKLLNGADLFIEGSFGGEMYGIPYNRNVDLKGAVGGAAGVDFIKLIEQKAVVVVQTNEGVVMQPPIKFDGELGVVVGKDYRLAGKQPTANIPPKTVTHQDVEDGQNIKISVSPGTLKTRSWRKRKNKAWVLKGPNGWYEAKTNNPVDESEVWLFEEDCFYGTLYKLEYAFGAGKVTLTKKDDTNVKISRTKGKTPKIIDYGYEASLTNTGFQEPNTNPVEIGPYKNYADLLKTIQKKL